MANASLAGGHGGAHHQRATRSPAGPAGPCVAPDVDVLSTLVRNASPFLFPCTIEYSLICAAILYVMWKNIAKMTPTTSQSQSLRDKLERAGTGLPGPYYKRSPHHYSVDCARAHKGLFVGILILVLTILSLILFFVLTSREEFVYLAVIEVNICELSLYAMSTIATLFGMLKVGLIECGGWSDSARRGVKGGRNKFRDFLFSRCASCVMTALGIWSWTASC